MCLYERTHISFITTGVEECFFFSLNKTTNIFTIPIFSIDSYSDDVERRGKVIPSHGIRATYTCWSVMAFWIHSLILLIKRKKREWKIANKAKIFKWMETPRKCRNCSFLHLLKFSDGNLRLIVIVEFGSRGSWMAISWWKFKFPENCYNRCSFYFGGL